MAHFDPKETFLTSTPSKAQHRPMSARAPTHNVDCPGNSLHSGEPFAEGPHLRGAVRVRPQPRGPHSQQLQANMVHFGYRTLRCPKLLQPSGFPTSELSSATLSFVDVKKVSFGSRAAMPNKSPLRRVHPRKRPCFR